MVPPTSTGDGVRNTGVRSPADQVRRIQTSQGIFRSKLIRLINSAITEQRLLKAGLLRATLSLELG